jgi:phenylalanyl-tRNA synthetase alpha chain
MVGMERQPLPKLHPQERLVMESLSRGSLTAVDIASATGLSIDSVNKACMWLTLKGMLGFTAASETELSLTPEGRGYRESGLPEKRLLAALQKGGTMASLKKEMPDLTVGLAWAKRKGWVAISQKGLAITAAGRAALKRKTPLEESLEREESKGDVLSELRSRKLVFLSVKKTKTFSLTPQGRKALPLLRKAPEEKSQLTPEDLRTGGWKGKKFRPYDIHTPVPTLVPAKLHPYVQFINQTRQKLIALGFQEMKGPFVETEFWNSDALFMPHDHPARGIHDIFRIRSPAAGEVRDKFALERVSKTHRDGWITGSAGWGIWDPGKTLRLIMRSQTTAVSVRTLASKPEIPSKFFTIDRNFRPDVIDATHLMEFHQCEGIVVGEGLNLRHLLGYLRIFGKEIAGAESVRFRPGYFPFTEPSVELDCFVNGRWMELGGSGIFRPEVTKPLGIDAPVLAWGMGFGRLAMIKLGITDMRDLFSHDLERLRRSRVVF